MRTAPSGAFAEVEDLVARRRALAGDQVHLVVAVEVVLVGPVADLLALSSSSVMFGLPAAARKVGNQSMPEMMPFCTVPAGTLPGQRTMAGTRKPPSMTVPLALERRRCRRRAR